MRGRASPHVGRAGSAGGSRPITTPSTAAEAYLNDMFLDREPGTPGAGRLDIVGVKVFDQLLQLPGSAPWLATVET
jgi:hypothetical protein